MKARVLTLLGAVSFIPIACFGQARGSDFQLSKITKNFISAPQFVYTGAQQYRTDQNERWLEVEVEFISAVAFTDELTLKYFILINGTVLPGEVTHANILARRDNRSVMYVPPAVLAHLLSNRPVTPASVQNIAVQIVQGGGVKDELSLVRGPPQWYTTIPALNGLVLNKNETPFAAIYWDRYVQIKKQGR